MIWIWRYLFGYLTIQIKGEFCEQFINLASANGITIWNLYWQNGAIIANVSIKNFLNIYKIRQKKKCKIKILNKHGLIFKTGKYNKRFGALLGGVLFFALLYFLTNFVWIININGNKAISKDEIIKASNKIGIYEGVSKSKINSKYDAQRLQLNNNKIAWCSFNLEGCVLNINITETKTTDKEERETPCNLKALIDGKITKIDVSSGSVSIKVGDTVSKGDLLVSGINQNSSSLVFVHSNGEIIAETKREFSAEGNYIQSITKQTGDVYKRRTIEFFGKKIPLYFNNITQNHVYKNKVKIFELFGNKIPIKTSTEYYFFTKEKEVKYDQATLENMLYKDIEKQVKKFDFISITEAKKETIKTEKGILLKITYICKENIAVPEEILFDNVN